MTPRAAPPLVRQFATARSSALNADAQALFDQLAWWARALKGAREMALAAE